jgi:hypothetical protein
MFDKPGFITGRSNIEGAGFIIDKGINKIKNLALEIPNECSGCINIYHCSRSCPDFCIFETNTGSNQELNLFRCHFHKLLTVQNIKQQAGMKLSGSNIANSIYEL